MSIPGWTAAEFAGAVNYALPEPYVVSYRDTFKFGIVSGVVVLTAGDPEIVNASGFRLIDIDIIYRHVFDTALLDRIE